MNYASELCLWAPKPARSSQEHKLWQFLLFHRLHEDIFIVLHHSPFDQPNLPNSTYQYYHTPHHWRTSNCFVWLVEFKLVLFYLLSLISVLFLTCLHVFSTCPVDWHKLTTMENTVTTASEVLLGSCVDLFKKGLITTGLELVAGLGPCQECSRYTLEVVLLCMFFSI